jgi:O-antigen/teichoic acid export membrane protein
VSRVEISKRLVAVNSASGVAAYVLSLSVLVWLQQHLIRRIPNDEYAIYVLVMSVIVFIVPLLTTVLTSGLARYVVEACAKDDEQRVTQITSTMFVVLLGAGTAFLALGLVFAWYVDRLLIIPEAYLWDARLMMALLVLGFAVSLPLMPFNVGMYVRQKFVLSNVINVASELFRIILLLILLLGVSTRVLWVVVASVTAQITTLVVNVLVSRRLVPSLRFRIAQVRWSLARPLVSFGSWNLVSSMANSLRNSSDPLILKWLAGPAASFNITCFNLASMVSRQFESGVGLIIGPVQPPLTAMYVNRDEAGLQSAYLRVGRFALWLTFLIVIPIVVFSREIVSLYVGPEYADTAGVIALLIGCAPIWYGHVMLPMVCVAKAQLRPIAWRNLVIQCCNVVLTLYLVGVLQLGMWGSALGTAITNVIGVPVLMYPLAFRMTGISPHVWFRQTVMPAVVPAFAAIAVCLMLNRFVGPASWPSLLACMAAGALSYVGAVALCGMQSQDRADVMRVFQRLRPAPRKLVAHG